MSRPSTTTTNPAEDRYFELFLEYHRGLSRQGPGSRASTEHALAMIPDLAKEPNILVLGCGPGAEVIDLVRATGGQVLALDLFQMFLDQLIQAAAEHGYASNINARVGDMAELEHLADGRYDLIWSEGAIYNIGFETGLNQWKRLLKPGGVLAVSEATWLTDDPSTEIKAYWDSEYPAMTTIEANLATVARCGYESLGQFTLPQADWWGQYYTLLEQRLPECRQRWADDEVGLAVVDDHEREIAITRKYLGTFGYAFYICERPKLSDSHR